MRTSSRFNKTILFVALSVLTGFGSTGCVTFVPVEEYTIARTALNAARESEAPRYAPALWYKAEQAYREGEAFYRDRHFDLAVNRFNQARLFSEQAENAARVARFESGDFAP